MSLWMVFHDLFGFYFSIVLEWRWRATVLNNMDNASYKLSLSEWLYTAPGVRLVRAEAEQLRKMLNGVYSPVAIQVGGAPLEGVIEGVGTSLCAVMGTQARGGTAVDVCCRPEQLPLGKSAAGLVVMPHTLDVSNDPSAVLREVAQVLDADGHIALSGFNPTGLWGLLNLFNVRTMRPPRPGCHYRLSQVQEWLALLGFGLVSGAMVYYRPPLMDETLNRKLLFMEAAGARWWPFGAAAYVLLAQKKTYGVTPMFRRRISGAGVRKPLAQSVTRG